MNILDRLYYHTWNIGFVEQNIENILFSTENYLPVHWIKHNYKDRFFADPFILSMDNEKINVLVEEFPYYNKKGFISILSIDRKSYELKEKKTILTQPFHMSYPFIMRKSNGEFWIAPEASLSGKLCRYTLNAETSMLINPQILVDEPLVDSTIIEYNGKWWLFCTKRGLDANKKLYIYYADTPEGPYKKHAANPVTNNAMMARPAGNIIKVDGSIYRMIQKCDLYYGETINVSRVDKLTTTEYKETFVKQLHIHKDKYGHAFHTINGFNDLCVVDGVKVSFSPFRKVWYELRNALNQMPNRSSKTNEK